MRARALALATLRATGLCYTAYWGIQGLTGVEFVADGRWRGDALQAVVLFGPLAAHVLVGLGAVVVAPRIASWLERGEADTVFRLPAAILGLWCLAVAAGVLPLLLVRELGDPSAWDPDVGVGFMFLPALEDLWLELALYALLAAALLFGPARIGRWFGATFGPIRHDDSDVPA